MKFIGGGIFREKFSFRIFFLYRAKLRALLFFVLMLSVSTSSLTVEPLKEIYIAPIIGHLDVGFTGTQREVKLKWQRIYREGIDLLERDSHAKLISDSLLPLEWFKESASEDEWTQFKKLVQSGRWELTAGWAHMNTSVMSEAEARRYFLQARKWEEELQTRIKVWHHADVPGLGWNMAESAVDAGIELIVVGANELGGLTPLPLLPPLFNWQSPDGETVTVSLHGGSGYLEGGLDLKLHVLDGLEERLQNFTSKLRKRGYQSEFAMVLFSSGDNRGPKVLEQLFTSVNEWNEKGKKPLLQITTFTEFNEKSKNMRNFLPTISVDFPAPWEALIMRAPRGERVVRKAKMNLENAEVLSIINNSSAQDKIQQAWRNVLLHDEHAGIGAWNGTLTREQLLEQNLTEYKYALDAFQLSSTLLSQQLSLLVGNSHGNDSKMLLLFNPTSTAKNLAKIGDDHLYSFASSYSAISAIVQKNFRFRQFKNDELYKWRLVSASEVNEEFLFVTKSLRIQPQRMLNISQLFLTSPFKAQAGEQIAVLEGYQNCNVTAYMRAGIWIDHSILAYSSNPKMFFTQEGALLGCENNRSLLLGGLSGAPLLLWRGQPAFVIYKQEVPIKFLDDSTGAVEQEPTAEDIIQHDIFVMETSSISPREAYLNFHELSRPQIAMRAKNITGGEKRIIYLRTDDPRAIIIAIWRADFDKEVVVAVRNISSERLVASLRSDYWDITQARRVDLLERPVKGEDLFCVDANNQRRKCEGAKLKPYLILEPLSVIYAKITIVPKKTSSKLYH